MRSGIVMLLTAMAGVGLWALPASGRAEEVRVIDVVASRFKFEPATIAVAEGEKVQLRLRSADRTHGLEIKALHVKAAIPRGETVTVEFVADRRGTFEITCSEYCGTGHSVMKGTLLVGARGEGRSVAAAPAPRFEAVAFDYLVLFDAYSVLPAIERVFPGKAQQLMQLWRTRQFEYTWLRSITGTYVDFLAITEDALVYAARALKLELTPDQRARLLDTFLHLAVWPDTRRALRRLRESGVRVIALANFTPAMLEANARHAGLTECFDALVSTDANHTYKPDPRAYALGIESLRLPKQDVLFAAFGGWDAAGAKAFGYPTAWVNRSGQPLEELTVRPDQICPDVDGLVDYVLGVTPACGH